MTEETAKSCQQMQNRRATKCLLWFAVFCVILGMPVTALAQKTPSETTEAGDEKEPKAPEKVDVEPVARDSQIEERLQNIFDEIRNKTERFNRVEVSVEDGVVYLSGEASKEEYRTWAADLAKSTQDVVAVVNRLGVQSRSVWDLSPAFAELNQLWRNTIQMSPLLLFAIVAFGLTWFAAKATTWITGWLTQRQIENRLLRDVVAKAAAIPVVLMGLYIVLRVFDLTQLAMTVIGGTGLAGLIIGIAFRDIAENLLASILISVQNPFRSGDHIAVDGHTGIAQRVTTRGTVLMTFDGNLVQIPNATIYKSTIVNYSANPNRRVEFAIGIGYDDSASEAQKTIRDELQSHPAILNDPPPRVLLTQLGVSTVNLIVRFWVDADEHNWESVKSSVMRILKQSLQDAGISIPDESREIIFPNGVPIQMLDQLVSPVTTTATVSTGGTAPHEKPNTIPLKPPQPREEVVSHGEGDLASKSAELERQAAGAWNPESGTNLLEADADRQD